MDLEEVWRIREELVYPALFGPVSRGIFTLSPELFRAQYGLREVDARWLHMGVFEFAPTPERPHWLYVTSGYSNPWDQDPADYDPRGDSGQGVEFTFAVSQQGDWAIGVLTAMLAYQLMLGAGHFPGRDMIDLHERIPLGAPINGEEASAIRNLMLVNREDGPEEFALPSGQVLLLGFTGLTDREAAFAGEQGGGALLDRLRAAGAHPVTDPARMSIL